MGVSIPKKKMIRAEGQDIDFVTQLNCVERYVCACGCEATDYYFSNFYSLKAAIEAVNNRNLEWLPMNWYWVF